MFSTNQITGISLYNPCLISYCTYFIQSQIWIYLQLQPPANNKHLSDCLAVTIIQKKGTHSDCLLTPTHFHKAMKHRVQSPTVIHTD